MGFLFFFKNEKKNPTDKEDNSSSRAVPRFSNSSGGDAVVTIFLYISLEKGIFAEIYHLFASLRLLVYLLPILSPFSEEAISGRADATHLLHEDYTRAGVYLLIG